MTADLTKLRDMLPIHCLRTSVRDLAAVFVSIMVTGLLRDRIVVCTRVQQ